MELDHDFRSKFFLSPILWPRVLQARNFCSALKAAFRNTGAEGEVPLKGTAFNAIFLL